MTSPQLEAYRAAYAAHSKLREDYDALCTTVAEAMRATAAELTPAAKRKNLIPVDGDAHRTVEAWRKVVPPAKRDELDARWLEQIRPQAEAYGRLMDHIAEIRRLAFYVAETIIGEGACWRLVQLRSSASASEYEERGKACVRVNELRQLGYQVRPVRRPWRPEGGNLTLEIWVWTCEEGERLARHQTPHGSLDDYIRTLANHGLNPIAATGNVLTVEQVNQAGGWRATGQPPHVSWERRPYLQDPSTDTLL